MAEGRVIKALLFFSITHILCLQLKGGNFRFLLFLWRFESSKFAGIAELTCKGTVR
jgi:hypothetical protein